MFLNFSPQFPSGASCALATLPTAGFEAPVGNRLSIPLSTYSTASGVYNSIRVVSAAVKIACMANSANNQGIIYSALWPRNVAIPTGAQFQSSELTAINRYSDGAVVTYRALDNLDREFTATEAGPPITGSQAATGTQFLFLISGFANSTSFLVDYIVNYECILRPGFSGIVDVQPSPVDASSMEFSERVSEATPPTSIGSVYEATIQAGSDPSSTLAATVESQSVSLYDMLGRPFSGGSIPYYANQAKKWTQTAGAMASVAAFAAPVLRRYRTEMKTPW